MAGGQERILRRRIKSVQSTKKITKAMELIAALAHRQGPGARRRGPPYSEQITEVIRNLAAGGAGLDHPLLRQPRRGPHASPTSSSPPTAACPAATTPASSATPSGPWPPTRADGRETAAVRRRQEGRRLLPLPRHTTSSRASSASPTSPPTSRPARSPPPSATAFDAGERRHGRPRLHPVPLGRHPAASCSARSCRSTPPTIERGGAERRPAAAYEFEPSPDAHPRPSCCPATPRPGSSPPCSTPRRPSTPPASGP